MTFLNLCDTKMSDENTEQVSARVTPEEKETCQKIAKVLYTKKLIGNETISEAIRWMVHYTSGTLIKSIELKRFGGPAVVPPQQ